MKRGASFVSARRALGRGRIGRVRGGELAGKRVGRALLLSPEALRVLLSYSWPGNVRELENALEFATIVCRGQTIQPEDFPPEVLRGTHPTGAEPSPAGPHDAQGVSAPTTPERDELARVLQRHGWRRDETARALGMSRSTLWRRMRRLGLA